jgi:hypothetical protein
MTKVATSVPETNSLETLVSEINRYENAIAQWDEEQQQVVTGLKQSIEALHKEALSRLIRTLKQDSMSALRRAVEDEVVYGLLRYHELIKPPQMKSIISLNPTSTPTNDSNESILDLLSPSGAEVILGQQPTDILAVPLQPSATTMFGSRGACLVSETGALWVADTANSRLLGWRDWSNNGTTAEALTGQLQFGSL